MGFRSATALAVLSFLAFAAFLVPPTAAQAGPALACPATPDITDPGNDHTSAPAGTTEDLVTGFQQIDLTNGCIAESQTAVGFLMSTATAPGANSAQTWTFTFHFKVGVTDYTAVVRQAGSSTSTLTITPQVAGATVTVSGTLITVSLPRTGQGIVTGTTVSDYFVDSRGTFIDPLGNVINGVDRAPNTGAAFPSTSNPYRVGTRAPGTLDSDGDGTPDRDEIANGTDPNSLDTDHDGLMDGESVEVPTGSDNDTKLRAAGILVLRSDNALTVFAGENEFGTDPKRPDTDGDGLLDGGNVTVPSGGTISQYFGSFGISPYSQQGGNDLFLGEYGFGSDPSRLDTDADGRTDYQEVTGEGNPYTNGGRFTDFPGSTDPTKADSDGDGLTDGEELGGMADLPDGTHAMFSPTDPNGKDTDHDGLTDYEELTGKQVHSDGTSDTFPHTDPTKADTDGDTYDDGVEVAAGSDPTDPNSIPGGGNNVGGAEASYLWLSTVAMLVVGLLCVVGILVRWG